MRAQDKADERTSSSSETQSSFDGIGMIVPESAPLVSPFATPSKLNGSSAGRRHNLISLQNQEKIDDEFENATDQAPLLGARSRE